jgi:hypothetical protein
VPASNPSFAPLPEDPATLKALLLAALAERDREQQRANEQADRAAQQGKRAEAQESLAREKSALAAEQRKRADDLYVKTLQLQLELERYKKWYYGPRADRLKSSGELGQALLNFGEELDAETGPPGGCCGGNCARDRVAAGEAAAGKARAGQLRESSGHHARLRVERERAGLPVLRRGAPGDRRGGELADRVHSRALRAHPACAQEVCLWVVRSFRRKAADHGGGAGGVGDRARAGGAGPLGVHRHQQVFRLPAAVPAGRDFRPPGIRDCAGHAVGVVRGGGRSGRTLVPAHGRAGAGLARGGHRRHRAAHAERGQNPSGAHVGVCGRPRIPTTCSTSP